MKDRFGAKNVQTEQYLRDADGNIVRDKVTGEGRRVDFLVMQDGKPIRVYEVTSRKASKLAQECSVENLSQQQDGDVVGEGHQSQFAVLRMVAPGGDFVALVSRPENGTGPIIDAGWAAG